MNKRESPDFRSPEVGISAVDLPGVCQWKICFISIHLLFNKRYEQKTQLIIKFGTFKLGKLPGVSHI